MIWIEISTALLKSHNDHLNAKIYVSHPLVQIFSLSFCSLPHVLMDYDHAFIIQRNNLNSILCKRLQCCVRKVQRLLVFLLHLNSIQQKLVGWNYHLHLKRFISINPPTCMFYHETMLLDKLCIHLLQVVLYFYTDQFNQSIEEISKLLVVFHVLRFNLNLHKRSLNLLHLFKL